MRLRHEMQTATTTTTYFFTARSLILADFFARRKKKGKGKLTKACNKEGEKKKKKSMDVICNRILVRRSFPVPFSPTIGTFLQTTSSPPYLVHFPLLVFSLLLFVKKPSR